MNLVTIKLKLNRQDIFRTVVNFKKSLYYKGVQKENIS